MKQKNWFRSILLLGLASLLMFISSCRTANDGKDDKEVGFVITFNVEQPAGSNASIKAMNGTTPVRSGDKVAKDHTVAFTLENLNGKFDIEWKGEGLNVHTNKMSATLKVSKAETIKVILKAKPQDEVTLTYEVVDNNGGSLKVKYGTPTATIDAPASGQKIPKNSQVKFTAIPSQDYEVESWEGVTGNAKQNEVTVTALNDLNVKVKFKKTTPSNTDWKITFTDIEIKEVDEHSKRKVTFSVKYPEFTLPSPAPFIDSIVSLDGDTAFPKDTKLTLKHTFVLKNGTENAPIISNLYTVTNDNVTKIYGSKIYGENNPKKQLSDEHIGATEKYELDIELPPSATEASYKILVKYALFANDDEIVQRELENIGNFDIPGYKK